MHLTTGPSLPGVSRLPLPGLLLQQGQGLGKALLKDAILRTMQAAEIAGLKLLLVHAKDKAAADFYLKHEFVPVADDSLKLFLPVLLTSG